MDAAILIDDGLVWLGLAWLGLAWLGLAWLGLAWLGLAWLGLAWLGFAWLGLAWLGLAWLGLAWLGLAWLGLAWLGLAWPISARHSRYLLSPVSFLRRHRGATTSSLRSVGATCSSYVELNLWSTNNYEVDIYHQLIQDPTKRRRPSSS